LRINVLNLFEEVFQTIVFMNAAAQINIPGITPGPPGIPETRPSAEAPSPIARFASSTELMQHILTFIM